MKLGRNLKERLKEIMPRGLWAEGIAAHRGFK